MNKLKLYSPWVVLIAMFLAQLVAAMGNLSIAPLSTFYKQSFNISHVEIGILTSLLATGVLLFAIPGGWLVDRYGLKKSMLINGSILSISFSLIGVFNQYMYTCFFMLLIGMTYGVMTPITNKAVFQLFHPKNRGLSMSFKQTGVIGGGALSSFLIVFFGDMFGWDITVILLGAVFFFIYIGITLIIRDETKESADTKELKEGKNLLLIDTLNLLKEKSYFILCLVMSLLLLCQFTLITYLLLFLNESLHFTLYWAGIGLTVFFFGGVFGRLLWGWVSDYFFRETREYVILFNTIIGLIFLIILTILSFYNISTQVWITLPVLFIIGLNLTGWNGVMMTMVTEEVPSRHTGLSSGISYSIGNIGTMTGVPITGFIIEKFGYTTAFSFLSIIVFIALMLISYFTYEKYRNRKKVNEESYVY